MHTGKVGVGQVRRSYPLRFKATRALKWVRFAQRVTRVSFRRLSMGWGLLSTASARYCTRSRSVLRTYDIPSMAVRF